MHKRGQVTLFIIFGILILIIAASFLFLRGKFVAEESEWEAERLSEEVQFAGGVQNFVESCIQTTGEDALKYISEHGGYVDLPEKQDEEIKVPYYFMNGEDLSPTRNTVEEELAKYMDEMLVFCLENFVPFKDQGFDIEQGSIETTARISPGKVSFTVSLPLYVAQGIVGREMNIFFTTIPSRMHTILEVKDTLISEIVSKPDRVNLGQIYDLSRENNLMIETSPFENDVYFFILDQEMLYSKELFEFRFVVQYSYGDLSTRSPFPEMSPIPHQEITAGEQFSYTVEATGGNGDYTYSDNTDLFDIDSGGEIQFVAEEAGEHIIAVTVEDGEGYRNTEVFTLIVK